MRKILFLAFVAIAFVGCSETSPFDIYDDTRHEEENYDNASMPMWASSHFITEYVLIDKIFIKTTAAGTLDLKFSGNNYSTYRDKDYEFYEKANYFSKLYGDMGYSKKVTKWLHPALAYPIEKITISCDKDFDAEHPIGTPLDDIVKLEYYTYYNFIQNGYKGKTEEETYFTPLNSINADVTKLSKVELKINPTTASWENYLGRFKFDAVPEKAGEYTFTIEMTTNGKTLKTTFTHTFE